MTEKPLPPGSTGWPLVGETVPFLKDQYAFVQSRTEQHGPIFKTNVLGRDTAILVGPEATTCFNDESKVMREGGMPKFVEEFFGGRSLPLLDGDVHRARKRQVLAAFSRDALESYLPTMQERIGHYLGAWADGGEVRASMELKRVALDVITRTMTSVSRTEDIDEILAGFALLAKGFGGLPIPLPGSAFSRALEGRDRIFAVLRRAVKEHREKKMNDGLGRVLAATAGDGSKIADDGAVLELLHFNIAGYIIFTHFAATIAELARRPAVKEKLLAEIDAHVPSGPLTLAKLLEMPYLECFVKEIKRYTPLISVFFGKARTDFELNGYRVPEGWMVLWGSHATNLYKESFESPGEFDPDRFSAARAEDKKRANAFSPQGAGELPAGHKCAGFDYATLLMQVFAVVAARDFEWTLPEQDLAYDYGRVPPEHKSGLRVSFRRGRSGR